jgi:hypothetical protein
LSETAGEVLRKAGAIPGYFSTPGNPLYDPYAPMDSPQWLHSLHDITHNVQIWGSSKFLGAGPIRDGLYINNSFVLPLLDDRPPYVFWDGE